MTEMADKPMCFAMGVGVVKGDQSTAVFRGSKAPLGRRTDRSSLARSQTSSSSIHTKSLSLLLSRIYREMEFRISPQTGILLQCLFYELLALSFETSTKYRCV